MRAMVPNRPPRPTQVGQYPGWPYLDTLYDYTEILNRSQPIATITQAQGANVAVVGAGAAGMLAAFEMLRMGLNPVVFEASDRIGGRNWSQPFSGTSTFAEMGAMRFPVSGKVFWYYADWFNLQRLAFPDPGTVPTLLYYENEALEWNWTDPPISPPPPPPGQFAKIQQDWDNFIDPFITAINDAYNDSGLSGVATVWQTFINEYAGVSFYQAVAQGIPSWGAEELNAFGALGLGSGGFGPLYDVNFIELLRIVLNQLEVDQEGIQGGVSSLTDGFYTTQVTLPDGSQSSLASRGAVCLGCNVTTVDHGPDGLPQVTWNDSQGNSTSQEFAAVIVATTTRAMQFLGLTLPTPSANGGVQALPENVRVAIRTLHLMSSSKMFIRTATKFWETDSNVPWNIQTDEVLRGVYTLDYPQTNNGVVLVSYTWGDDSDKLLALAPQERFEYFVNVLHSINPAFAAYLDPVGGEVLNVDWEAESPYFGAFKLNLPGQDPWLQSAYFHFQTAGTSQDTGIYVAGDSVSWTGGWTEGALETGINAACAVATHLGCTFPNGSPMSQDATLYSYGPS